MNNEQQQRIGKYRIIEKIGQGGFGDVYKAEDSALGSTVALKLLAPHYMRDPNVVQRFRREACAAARLRHPNIVHIYDLVDDQGTLFLVMDYLPGLALARILAAEGSLPLSEVTPILTQVADALDYAHQQGLVHRDVKPANIMIDGEGRVTLMDFGLVRAADNTPWSLMQLTGSTEPTTGGAMMGTPQYMAPEQAEPNAEAATIGPWTDIYSLGVVVYQMLTGQVLFEATTPLAVLRGHVDKEPRPPSQLADMPPGVEAAILKALAKPPKNRWPTAGAFAKAVARAAGEAEETALREKRLTVLYQQAQQAIAEEQWVQALALCGQIMSLDASLRDVGALFDKANAGMRRQRDWEAQQAELAALYDRAVAHMAAGEWHEAITALEQVEATSTPYVFRDTLQKLAQARQVRERTLADRRRRVVDLQEKVLASIAEALSCIETIKVLEPACPGLQRVEALLRDAQREWSPEPVTRAEEALPTPPRAERSPSTQQSLSLSKMKLRHWFRRSVWREKLSKLGASLTAIWKAPESNVRTVALWLLGLSVLLGLPGFGIGVVGIAGAIGMLRGHSWGRKAGLSFSLLLEVLGLAAAALIVTELFGSGSIYNANVFGFWVACAAALLSVSAGIIAACLLGQKSILDGLGEKLKRPAGVWPIAIPMMLTGLGAIPAAGLIRNRDWGRVATMVFLCICAAASIIGAIMAGTEMELRFVYHSGASWEAYYYQNMWGPVIALVEAAVIAIWCVVAFFYLRRPQVKRWFHS